MTTRVLQSPLVGVTRCSIQLELGKQLSVNPYPPPSDENSKEETSRLQRKPHRLLVQRLPGYVRTVLGTLFVISLFFTLYWDANASPFFAYLLLPLIVFAGLLWTLVEFMLLPVLKDNS